MIWHLIVVSKSQYLGLCDSESVLFAADGNHEVDDFTGSKKGKTDEPEPNDYVDLLVERVKWQTQRESLVSRNPLGENR